MENGVILVKDMLAEKSQSSFGGFRSSSKSVRVLKGELLIPIPGDKLVPRNNGGKPHNYRLARDTTVSLRAEPNDVAPLNQREFALLESNLTRYSIFLSCKKLDWSLLLRKGSEVFVTVNPEAPQSAWIYSKAVVHWFGKLGEQRGIFFGVEIMEEKFRGQGTTDGTFQGKRYFYCEDGCGFFVALDQLSLDCPRFKVKDRVVVYNSKCTVVHGTVQWVGKLPYKKSTYVCGLEMDIPVKKDEFPDALYVSAHLLDVANNRKLFLYEPFIRFEEEIEKENKETRLSSSPRLIHSVSDASHNRGNSAQAPQHLNGSDQPCHFQRSTSSPPRSPQLEAQHEHGRQPHQQPQPSQLNPGSHLQPSDSNIPSTVALSPDPALALGIGSMVQVSGHYGVVQWIGELAEVQGTIAGVELEEGMNGCTDGSRNGVQYFTCKPGRGFFCPLSSLRPDEREISAVRNPLRKWPLKESTYQYNEDIDISKYIGGERGIQGHQNSCFLDATVFGLFAVSDVFDSVFLTAPDVDVSEILWKRIVNPLRKYGVVRYESVMALRNKLEEIGKMKGVNQDEKDPEEFLNMLFKHALHVEPFITIKRPFGMEQEFFVQLFLEFDERMKIPSVGSLLRKMFKEQSISFTEAPSKLLIQVPRFGKKFKTYDKIVPDLQLGIEELLPSPCKCLVCSEPAQNKCNSCLDDGSGNSVYFCDVCCDRAHSEATNRGNHQVETTTTTTFSMQLLSVICIETSHYVCFTHSEGRWIFMDSMANRVYDTYYIPKGVDCTQDLNEWVYTQDQTRFLSTPPRELPEYVRRFTQDIYMCVYIDPDLAMYGRVSTIAEPATSQLSKLSQPEGYWSWQKEQDHQMELQQSHQKEQDLRIKLQQSEQDLQTQLQQLQHKEQDLQTQLTQAWQTEQDLQRQMQQKEQDFQAQLTQARQTEQDLQRQLQQKEQDFQAQLTQARQTEQDLQRQMQQKEQDFQAQLTQARQTEQDLQRQLQQKEQDFQAQLTQARQTEQDLQRQLQQKEQDFQAQLTQARQTEQDLQKQLQQKEQDLQTQLTQAWQTEQDLQRQLQLTTKAMQDLQLQSHSREVEFWNVPRSDIRVVSEIDRGGWGTVFKGTFQGRAVAIKQLHPAILSNDNIQRLRREVHIMSQGRHPNLLLFIAAVFDDEVERLRSSPLIVMELLDTDLRKAYQTKLILSHDRIPIFRDVAFALNYLHHCRDPIIHRDLSAPNVLLEALANNRWKAKISDFGSANLVKFAQTKAEGAIIYSAPETLPDEIRDPNVPTEQTPKIDVYSYGVLLCEVITCKLPDKFKQMKAEVEQSWPFMHSLITSCTSRYPDDRPTMDQVLSELKKIPWRANFIPSTL